MQPNKLSLAAIVAGVVMFFLPWVEFQCKGVPFVRQSGLQTVTGAVSIADEITSGAKMPQREGGKSAGIAWFIIASAAFLLLALWTAWNCVRDDIEDTPTVARFALAAAAFAGAQMAIGFPLDKTLREELQRSAPGRAPKDAMEAAMQEQIKGSFQTKYLPSLYLYLAALAVPVAQWLMTPRRERGSDPFSAP